jgi:hypothetical protein
MAGQAAIESTYANGASSKTEDGQREVKMPRGVDDYQRRTDVGDCNEPKIKPHQDLLL